MSELVRRAAEFAYDAHEGQVRKYTHAPYFTHCLAVADLVRQRSGTEEMIAAALLHDVLEDTDTKFFDLRHHFGNAVADLVLELTDMYARKDFPSFNRKERKRLECKRLAHVSKKAKLIKLCDLIDNTSSIVRYDPKFAVTYLREKADLLEAMGFAD